MLQYGLVILLVISLRVFRGITTPPPFPAKHFLYETGLQLVCSAHSFHPYNHVSLYASYWLIPHYGEDLFPRERITSTYVWVSNMQVVHICPIPLIAAWIQLKIVTTRSSNWWRLRFSRSWCTFTSPWCWSLWKLHPACYNHLQIYRAIVTVATSPLPAYYDRTFPLLMGLCQKR